MTQLEIVLNGIDEVRNSGIQCPLENVEPRRCVYFPESLIDEIVSLLKAQEARLLTKKEIISWEGYIWKEFKGMTAMKALLIDHGMEREPYMGDFPTNSYLWDNYNQYWRCWSTQPTKEQREAVKWE